MVQCFDGDWLICETKASHSQRIWVDVSSSAPHLLHKGLCSVRRSVTTLDCVVLTDISLVLAVGLRSEINSRACLWVLPRPSVKTAYFASLCDLCALMAPIEHRYWNFQAVHWSQLPGLYRRIGCDLNHLCLRHGSCMSPWRMAGLATVQGKPRRPSDEVLLLLLQLLESIWSNVEQQSCPELLFHKI